MFTKAEIDIYNIDVEDIITTSDTEVKLEETPGEDWG